MESSRALSREEQEELLRSKKKVKDVSHAGFQEGLDSAASSPRNDGGFWSKPASFKDKLVSQIPGAFTQAFNFGNLMEDDIDSDEEVEGLREGLVAVKFSKELKQRIRSPWYKALIVKVYGWSVGLNFLQNRLLTLWRPAGRLDCVDLTHGFFLTRFSLREDYEATLKRGPWFIREHFLSIRPWEPDFLPATANVSSVAVWIRLNDLPIEYYHAEALLQIGKAIGNVLRVDTHTASESRGRFARLCVQVDVEKPLVTAILIGKREQPVCYERIHKLCFGCGRIGHRKEQCPFVIRQPSPSSKEANQSDGVTEAQTCNAHDTESAKQSVGPGITVHGSAQKGVPESTYDPWVVVMRKKQGVKQQRHEGTTLSMEHGQTRAGKELRSFMPQGSVDTCNGPSRDVKRKLPVQRVIDGLQVANVVQHIVKEGPKPVSELKEAGLSIVQSNISLKPSDRKTAIKSSKPNPQASVKGKKGLARNRALQSSSQSIRASAGEKESRTEPPLVCSILGRNPHEEELGSEEKLSGLPSQGHCPTGSKPKLGFQFRGGCSRDHDAALNGEKCDGGDSEMSAEGSDGEDGREFSYDMELGADNNTEVHAKRSGFEGASYYATGAASKGEADRKVGGVLERMELEDGVDGTSAP